MIAELNKWRIVALSAVVLTVLGISLLQASPSQGCTPGYWKNHLSAWPAGYSPSDPVTAHFSEAFGAPASLTLLQALQGDGGPGAEGGERILLRAAVAALLNAASFGAPGGTPFVEPDYLKQVIVNPALATEDRGVMLGVALQLDGWNNLGCPL